MEVRLWCVCYIQYQCWSQTMSVLKEALTRSMNTIITELEQEGLIDNLMNMCYGLKDVNGPYYFANLLQTLIEDTQNAILELGRLLEQAPINFQDMDQIAIKLRGSTSCVGICALAQKWLKFREGTQIFSKERCLLSLNEIRYEFVRIHSRLDAIIQLEREFVRL
ncbi:histidine-containing phosphotransfer protein 5-like isoform X2 [Chenopodium quinoa]|uniref:histidine-containing phosphotransfer protein 5-like isoform X2 n=1 Tax=Chenopodium quinoa TaxID=63459 RepID=UPI000B773070|nr:histidine-containing phosphotransfer protein 5-like isoform X2 [Chenopodium quinoa]